MLAIAALVIALSGTAYAAGLARNSVGHPQIKAEAVRTAEIRSGAVGATQTRDRSLTSADLRDGSVSGTEIRDGSTTAGDLSAAISRARAHGVIQCSAFCFVEGGRGITSVTTPAPGVVCVTMPGLDPTIDVPLAFASLQGVSSNTNDAVQVVNGRGCGVHEFGFSVTTRPFAYVRNANGDGTSQVLGYDLAQATSAHFTLLVP